MKHPNSSRHLNGPLIAITLFALTTLIQTAIADVPMMVDDSLVSFSPAIRLNSESECQGTRIAKQLVATSPLCAQAIYKRSENTTVEILDTGGKKVGKIVPFKGSLPLNSLDQEMLLDVSDAVSTEFDTYPALRNSDAPADTAYAYFKDNSGAIVQESVVATELSASLEQRHFDVASATALPSGTMVMDDQHNLICLMSVKNQCLSVPLGQTVRTRELNQYGESSDEIAAQYLPQILLGSAVAVLVAGAVGTFYLVSFVRARHLSIPAGVFWQNICNYGYCSGWSPLSTVQCILGTACCPFTYGYSAACCWTASLTAAWNWVEAEARQTGIYAGISDQQPFIQDDQQIPTLPGYSPYPASDLEGVVVKQ